MEDEGDGRSHSFNSHSSKTCENPATAFADTMAGLSGVGIDKDVELMSLEEKIVYVWRLYLNSEQELKSTLERLDFVQAAHSSEMAEIEANVLQIKSLSDQREALTLDLECENDNIKLQMEQEKNEIREMFVAQDLTDVTDCSLVEQVAFLLVERAKLLDDLDTQRSPVETMETSAQTDTMEHSDADTQTLDTSELINYSNVPVEFSLTATSVTPCADDEDLKSAMDFDTITDDLTGIDDDGDIQDICSVTKDHEVEERCGSATGGCTACSSHLRKIDDLSTQLIVSEDQLKSLERRINRYKLLVRDGVSDGEDKIAELELTLDRKEKELNEAREEIDDLNKSLTEQHHNDSGSHHVNLLELKQLKIEVRSLNQELSIVKENSESQIQEAREKYERQLEEIRSVELGKASTTLSEAATNTSGVETMTVEAMDFDAERRLLDTEILDYQNQLEQTMESYQMELTRTDELEAELVQLRGELEALRSSQAPVLRDKIEAEKAKSFKELSSLTSDYEQATSQLEGLTTEHEQLTDAYSKLESDFSKSRGDYTALQQIHEIVSEEVESLMSQCETLTNQLTKQKASNLATSQMCDQKAEELSSLQTQLSDCKSERDDAMQQLEKLRRHETETLDEITEKCSNLKVENTKLSDNIVELSSKLEEAELEIESITQTKIVLERRICQLNKDNSELSSQCDEYTALQNKHSDLVTECDRLNEEYEVMKRQCDSLQTDLLDHDKQYDELVQKCKQLEEQDKLFKIEEDKLIDEISQLKENLAERIANESELIVERDRATSQLGSVKLQWQNLKPSYEQLQCDHKQLQAMLAEVQSDKHVSEVRLEQVDLRANKLESTADQLKSENIKLSIENKSLNESNQKLTNQCTELTDEVERLQTRCNHLRKEFEFVKSITKETEKRLEDSDVVDTSASARTPATEMQAHSVATPRSNRLPSVSEEELNERILLLEKAANQLESDNRDLAAKLKEALTQNDALQSNHKHDLQRLKAANTRLQEQVERHKTYSETLEKELEALQVKVKDQSQRLQESSQLKEGEILSLKTELSQLKLEYEKKVESLEDQLRHSDAELRLQREKASNVRTLVSGNEDTRERIQLLESERDSLTSRVLDLQAEVLELKSTSQAHSHRLQSESSKAASDAAALQSSKEREAELQNDNYQLRQKIIDLETRVNSQLSENLSLKHQVDDASSKSKTLSAKLSSLQEEKETLELELTTANEKLSYRIQRHRDKKTKLQNKINNSRMVFDGEVMKYKERIEDLSREIRHLNETMKQAEKLKLESDKRYSTLVTDNRANISKLMDLEDDVRERNRCITLLQTKLHYTEKENADLNNLCNKLKQLNHPLLSPASLSTPIINV